MTNNSIVIVALCSRLCTGDDVFPLEPREWSELAQTLLAAGACPGSLLELPKDDIRTLGNFSEEFAERLIRLIDRIPSLEFEISKYEAMGIRIITRADHDYPRPLKKKLASKCPPLFYCAGNADLLTVPAAGYVGSRAFSSDDEAFTRAAVRKTASQGYAVVSGGAKGVDQTAADEAIRCGASVIEYLSDSMLRQLRRSEVIDSLHSGKRVLLSAVNPDAGFNAGMAMTRNRYIYAQAEAVIVIRSDYNKGGTWAGATDNLKNRWCDTFCRNRPDYPGNTALIRNGAIPIDDDWNGNLRISHEAEPEQLSLF